MILLEDSFPNVQFYMINILNTTGTIKFMESNFTFALYFVEKGYEDTPNPFLNDRYILTPLSDPSVSKDHHHLFDLGYYSEITIIEMPPRLCFHDPSKDPGIALNFESKEDFSNLFNYLLAKVTIITPGLPGFYKIVRFHPPLTINTTEFQGVVQNLKEEFLKKPNEDSMALFEAQNQIIPKITPLRKSENISVEDFQRIILQHDRKLLQETIIHRILPNEVKIDAWCEMCEIGDVSEPNAVVLESYRRVKQQFKSITESQFKRSTKRRNDILNLSKSVEKNIEKLITVVNDELIPQIAFNVLMSIAQTYDFLFGHIDALISILRVLLWLFVRSVKRSEIFEVREGVEYDQETLEAVLYWSMLFLIEKFEIKKSVIEKETQRKKKREDDTLGDLCFLLHPNLYQLLYTKGIHSYVRLAPLFTLQFSTLLTLCDCVDVWLYGISSKDPILFMQCMVLSGIFFYFPNISSIQFASDQTLTPIIEQIFKALGHTYLQKSGYILMGQMKNLIIEHFPELENYII